MTRQYLCDHCGRVLEWRYQGWDNFMEKSITCDVKKIVDQIYEVVESVQRTYGI